ncbi:MAG: hypothetical protein MZW92_57845 [Comamonadaceae bacterium]|nr:hypothetical protein [Comamonadaceae bacterium]
MHAALPATSELAYLRGLRFIKSDFVDFLRPVPASTAQVHPVEPRSRGPASSSIVIKGPWLHTILFEIPVLAIVNEVYFRATQHAPDFAGRGPAPAAREDRR